MSGLSLLTRFGLTRPASPAPPGDGYRYYRLRITAFGANYNVNLAALQLRETIGGADVAPLGTPTANASFGADWAPSKAFDNDPDTFWATPNLRPRPSSGSLSASPYTNSTIGAPYEPTKAFDGDASTFWATGTNVTAATIAWAFIQGATPDLHQPHVRDYKIRARSDAADGAPKNWKLQRLTALAVNGDWATGTWEDVHTVRDETSWATGEERTFTAPASGPAPAWRLNISANNGRNTINVAEITFVGFGLTDSWLQVDFGAGSEREITQYALTARKDSATGAPTAWTLEASNDLTTWDVLDTRSSETGWTAGETRVFTI